MRKINKIVLIALLAIPFYTMSQERRPTKERVESMKIGFITNKLNLTPEEAKIFWPVYNQYSSELEKLRKGRRENIQDAREAIDSMSNDQLEKAVDNEINFRQSEIDILKKYHPQFKKVLPIKKVALLYKAEEDFKRNLLELIKERKNGKVQGPKGPPPPKE